MNQAALAAEPVAPGDHRIFPAELGDFDHFCADLGARTGVSVDPERRMRLLRLLHRLANGGVVMADARSAADYITPVFAVSPTQQQRVRNFIIELWTDEVPEPIPEKAPETQAERAVAQADTDLKTTNWLAWAIGIPIAGGVLYGIYKGAIGGGTAPVNTGQQPDPGAQGGTSGLSEAIDAVLQALSGTQTGVILVIVIAVVAAFTWWMRRRRFGVLRDFSFRDVTTARLRFDRRAWSLFRGLVGDRAVSGLAGYRPVPSRTIDVPATIRATIENEGAADLRYRTEPRLPEYVILLDRASADDHMTIYAEDLAFVLTEYGVAVERFDYHTVPNRLYRPDRGADDRQTAGFRRLTDRAEGRRLILLADANALMDARGTRPLDWVERLSGYDERILLTPAAPAHWGPAERRLADTGFQVETLSEEGLRRLSVRIGAGRQALERRQAVQGALLTAARKARRTLEWIRQSREWNSEEPPPDAARAELVDELQSRLEALQPGAFELMAALSVYPEMTPELTRMIGKTARDAGGRPLMTEARLAALAQLPWFRRGRIPDWLRQDILARLAPERRADLETAVHAVLLEPGQSGRLSLEVVQEHRSAVTDLLDSLLPRDAAARKDAIFMRSLGRETAGGIFRVSQAFARAVTGRSWLSREVAAMLGIGGVTAMAVLLLVALVPGVWETAFVAPYAWLAGLISVSEREAFIGCIAVLVLCHVNRHVRLIGRLILGAVAALITTMVVDLGWGPDAATGLIEFCGPFLLSLFAGLSPVRDQGRPINEIFHGDRWWLSTIGWTIVCLSIGGAEIGLASYSGGLERIDAVIFVLCPVGTIVLVWMLGTRLRLAFRSMAAMAFLFYLAILTLLAGQRPISWFLGDIPHLHLYAAVAGLLAYLVRLGVLTRRQLGVLLVGAVILATLVPDSALPFAMFFLAATLLVDTKRAQLAPAPLGAAVIGFGLATWLLPLAEIYVLEFIFEVVLADAKAGASIANEGLLSRLLLTNLIWPALRIAFPHLHTSPEEVEGPRRTYEWPVTNRGWIWLLVPVNWIFATITYNTGPWSWTQTPVYLLLAVWLGARFGRQGFRVLMVSMAPLAVGLQFGGLGTGHWGIGFILACAMLARLAGMPEFRRDVLRATWLAPGAVPFLCIGLTAYVSYSQSFGGLDLSLGLDLSYYLSVIFLILGLSRIPLAAVIRPFLLVAAIYTLAIWIRADYGFNRFAGFGVFPSVASILEICTLLVCYVFGAALRRVLVDPDALAKWRVALATLLFMAMLADGFRVQGTAFDDWIIQVNPRIEFVSNTTVLVLSVAVGLAGGWRGLLAGVAIHAAFFVVPILMHVYALPWEDGLDTAFASPLVLFGTDTGSGLELYYGLPGSWIGPTYSGARGWTAGFLDVLAVVFGWRLWAGLVRRQHEADDTNLLERYVETPAEREEFERARYDFVVKGDAGRQYPPPRLSETLLRTLRERTPYARDRSAILARRRVGPDTGLPVLRPHWVRNFLYPLGGITMIWAVAILFITAWLIFTDALLP